MKNHENLEPGTMKNHENRPRTMKNQPGTMKNHENQSGTMKNQTGTMKNHENRPGQVRNKQKRHRQTNRSSLLYIDFFIFLYFFPFFHYSLQN